MCLLFKRAKGVCAGNLLANIFIEFKSQIWLFLYEDFFICGYTKLHNVDFQKFFSDSTSYGFHFEIFSWCFQKLVH
jgi:hypothetical protein